MIKRVYKADVEISSISVIFSVFFLSPTFILYIKGASFLMDLRYYLNKKFSLTKICHRERHTFIYIYIYI